LLIGQRFVRALDVANRLNGCRTTLPSFSLTGQPPSPELRRASSVAAGAGFQLEWPTS
jgi:hypothetical protein